MERRKFIIGAGALATGSSAAVGTGAFTSADADRVVDVSVTADDSSFMSFKADESEFTNGEYAAVENGKLNFNFNSDADITQENGFGVSGEGLNPDSTYYFDDVFGLYNGSSDDLQFNVDWSGLTNSSSFEFYWLPAGVSYSDSRPENIGNGDYTEGTGTCPSGSFERMGIAIEAPSQTNGTWETGSVTISAYDPNEVNNSV